MGKLLAAVGRRGAGGGVWAADHFVLLRVARHAKGFPLQCSSANRACSGWGQIPFLAMPGSVDMDPAHRRHDNMYLAMSRAGLTFARDEVLLTQCLTHAPWGSMSNFGTLKEAACEFFTDFDESNDLFTHFYPAISMQLHAGVLPSTFLAWDHKQWVWECCRESWIFRTSGSQTKAGRWYQVFEASSKALVWWKVYEMILCYIGLHQGWLEDCKGEDVQPLVSTVAAVEASAAARQERRRRGSR